MGNLFDAIIIAFMLITVVVCSKLGFIRMLKPFRKVVALVLAWSFKDTAIVRTTVGKFFHTEDFKAFLNERVDVLWGEKIKTAATADGVSLAERFDGIFGFWGKLFGSFKDFCISLYDKEYSGIAIEGELPSEQLESFVKSVTGYVADAAAGFFSALIGFIALYIIFSLAFWLAIKLLNPIFDKGLLGAINHTLGFAVGICYSFFGAWLLSIVFIFFLPLVSTVDISSILGGYLGLTEWFYTKFFISMLLGMTI